jgi:hypothetical protein
MWLDVRCLIGLRRTRREEVLARAGAVVRRAPHTRSPHASREVGESTIRMEAKGKWKIMTLRELRRIPLPRTSVNNPTTQLAAYYLYAQISAVGREK